MFKQTINKIKAIFGHSAGQLSVFLGMSLIVLMTLLAFIINVGLFVKAKINLQNAVDASAWAGAAVQAKQLTNIAYLNWEMRNTYKEWMFKYYVLGQASLIKTRLTENYNINNLQSSSNNMSFRADETIKSGGFAFSDKAFDKYNVPSICFHFGQVGTEFNICNTAMVPGLPRFDPISIPGISEHQEVFLDSIVKTKAKNCSQRTDINFSVALMWAYGVGETIIPGAPAIASNRPGAWPKAFELAIRMRNLESFVNRAAIDGGICYNYDCDTEAMSLDNQFTSLPFNERPIKAFWSGYKNLTPEMQQRFILYELAPNVYFANEGTLSTFLIPTGASVAGKSVSNKQYLDLQAYPLNLVTYFSSFASTSGVISGNVATQAECTKSHTAIPVPGYLFGFIKNPDVLTYYAVKGETQYVGLFYPFQDSDGIKLKAYAAAKPFGGRIGPRLFHIENNTQVRPRKSSMQYRSLPYITGINTIGGSAGARPDPIVPLTKSGGGKFFVSSDTDVIGGIPDGGDNLVFGIPNLLYEYQQSSSELTANHTKNAGGSNDTIQIARAANSIADAKNIHEFAGLYDKTQYRMFAANIIPLGSTTNITAQSVNDAIINVRRPTKYEAMNYLVPTCNTNGDSNDSFPTISKACNRHDIFAPFIGQEALHKNTNDLLASVETYIDQNNSAIDAFLAGLKDLADRIRASVKTNDSMIPAANSIWRPEADDSLCTNLSIAGKFRIFFKGKGKQCDINPIGLSLEQYWSNKVSADANFSNYFIDNYKAPTSEVVPPSGKESIKYHTGYMPGVRQGANANGEVSKSNKLTSKGGEIYSRRNFYSTKLVPIASLTKTGRGSIPSYSDLNFYQENINIGNDMPDVYPNNVPNFLNHLPTDDLTEFGQLTH